VSDENPKQTCRGTRKDGKPCTSPVVLSNGYCSVHQGQVPKAAAPESPSAVEDAIPEEPTQERPSTIQRRTTTRRNLLQVDQVKKIAKGLIGWAVGSAAWDETRKRADPYDEPVKEFFGDLVDEFKGVIGDLKKLADDVDVRVPDRPKAVATVHPLLPEMVPIPAGEFLMGSDPEKDKAALDDEQPQHSLCLPEYHIARTPVTNAQYLQFVKATGHRMPDHWQDGKPPRGEEHHPVVNVSWYDAMEYCRWLSGFTGKPYRLPSEAEWEKGARGTDGRVYPWGDKWDSSRCNTRESSPGDITAVATYPQGASPYGLLDMAGNVWEWTISLWRESWQSPTFRYPYDRNDGRENLDAGRNVLRVVRGGSFYYNPRLVRCADRGRSDPSYRGNLVGFRVVVSPISPPSAL
jgi:formylglycine-generating enzyme required for sulfatase activity